MNEGEGQHRDAVGVFVGIGHQVNPDRICRQLYLFYKMRDSTLVLRRKQRQGFVSLAMMAEGLRRVPRELIFPAKNAQRIRLVRRAVGEVKMQGYLFCDSGAHEILLLS